MDEGDEGITHKTIVLNYCMECLSHSIKNNTNLLRCTGCDAPLCRHSDAEWKCFYAGLCCIYLPQLFCRDCIEN